MPVRAASETLSTGEDRPAYGGTYFGTRHPPLGQINRENVDNLGRVWAYRTGDLPPEDSEAAWSPETTPPKIDGVLVLCTLTNIVLRVDAAIGREEWRYDPQLPMTPPHAAACRGVAHHADPEAVPNASSSPRSTCASSRSTRSSVSPARNSTRTT